MTLGLEPPGVDQVAVRVVPDGCFYQTGDSPMTISKRITAYPLALLITTVMFLGGVATGAAEEKDNAAESTPKVTVRNTVNRVLMEATLDKVSGAGESLVLSVSIKNENKKEVIYYQYRNLPNGIMVSVVDSKGKPVPLTRWGTMYWKPPLFDIRKTFRSMTLKHNETLKRSFNLARYYDLTVPGEYSVSVSWQAGQTIGEVSVGDIKLKKMDVTITEG